MKILPCNEAGDNREYTISASAKDIESVLGFPANIEDDPDKVKHSWGFLADGKRCGIWDYKGSYRQNIFSAWGPREVFESLFGRENVTD